MGMSNEEIAQMIANEESSDNEKSTSPIIPEEKAVTLEISQEEMDSLLTNFVSDENSGHESLLEEIHEAILDSGKLSLMQWVKLRERLREIEELVPHIDLLIKLKSKAEKSRTD